MTDNVTMNPEDRALWDRYVRSRRGALAGAGEREPVDGTDAALIAAYLGHRLDEWECAAFERRLVDEPALLEALLAARDAVAAAEEPAPQALTAYALNLVPARAAGRPVAPGAAPRRRWFLPAPAFSWSLATVAFLAAFAAGAFLTWQLTEPPAMAQKEPAKKPEFRPGNGTTLEEPAKTTSDGVDTRKQTK